jgi:hypothetical protein
MFIEIESHFGDQFIYGKFYTLKNYAYLDTHLVYKPRYSD